MNSAQTVLRSVAHFLVVAPDVAALALSGDWTAEFLSGSDSAAAPGLTALGDAADADWTREFIAEAAGNLSICRSVFGSGHIRFA